MSIDIVQAAAARAAHLRAELKKLEGVETLATQAHNALMSPALQLSRCTFALGDGKSFSVQFDDANLAQKVRELIAADREAKAAALIGDGIIPSPQQQAEQQPPPAPEPTVASSAAAVDSTPARDPEAPNHTDLQAAIERARGAGHRYRAEQNGLRKSPYKPGPLTEAWLAGWDEADAKVHAEASAREAAARAADADTDTDVDPMAAPSEPAPATAPAPKPAAKPAAKSAKGLF